MVTATASVAGRAHRHRFQGAQDAVAAVACGPAVARGPGCGPSIVVVCDGCSSGAHSEVGAGVGARFVAAACARRISSGVPLAALPDIVFADLREQLASLARSLSLDPHDARAIRDVIAEHLLFTVLAAVALDDQAIVFGAGDGVVVVDGRVSVIDEGPAPNYPAYALPEAGVVSAAAHTAPIVHHHGAFDVVAVATDGAAELTGAGGTELVELAALARAPFVGRLTRNPSLLQKRLNAWVTTSGGPVDDCTIGLIARRALGGGAS